MKNADKNNCFDLKKRLRGHLKRGPYFLALRIQKTKSYSLAIIHYSKYIFCNNILFRVYLWHEYMFYLW